MWLRASYACYIPYTFSSVQTHKRETRNDAIMVHRRPSSARLHWPGDSQMESQEPILNSDGNHSKRNTGLDRHPLLPPTSTASSPSTSHYQQPPVHVRGHSLHWGDGLWSSMGNERLSGLAMMHMHRNRALDPEKFWGAGMPLDTEELHWHLKKRKHQFYGRQQL